MDSLPEMLEPWVRSCNPPAGSATPEIKVRWLREFVRLSANDFALAEIYGLDSGSDHGGLAESLLICIGMAERIGATRQQGILAARAEWATAQERAVVFSEELRRALWTLGRDRAPGGEILARAHAVNQRQNDRAGLDLRDDDLLTIARQIVTAAATGRRPHGR